MAGTRRPNPSAVALRCSRWPSSSMRINLPEDLRGGEELVPTSHTQHKIQVNPVCCPAPIRPSLLLIQLLRQGHSLWLLQSSLLHLAAHGHSLNKRGRERVSRRSGVTTFSSHGPILVQGASSYYICAHVAGFTARKVVPSHLQLARTPQGCCTFTTAWRPKTSWAYLTRHSQL